MALNHALSTNNYGICRLIVDINPALGTHITLTAAMADAVSGDTILMRVSVTENVTLTPGVNIIGLIGSELTPTISITGTLTMTAAGSCTIAGIRLTTNSAFFLAVTGSAASIVNLEDCYLNILNNTGISHTSSSGSSMINIIRCRGEIGTTLIAIFVSTSAGGMEFAYSKILNSGASVTASSISTGQIIFRYSEINSPLSTSSVGSYTCYESLFLGGGANATSITTVGTGTATFNECYLSGGSSSAVSVGAGTTVICAGCDLNSSNTNVVTGAGTFTHTSSMFTGTSSVMNPTTLTGRYTNLAQYKATSQPAFLAVGTTQADNITGDGTVYTLVGFNTEIFDQNSNFASNTFTAPVTGVYRFDCSILYSGLLVTHTQSQNTFITSNRNFLSAQYNAYAAGGIVGGQISTPMSCLCDMDAADTCVVSGAVFNGTKVIDIVYNGTADPRTWFAGNLVC